jgi:biopolymer transport protein ExbD
VIGKHSSVADAVRRCQREVATSSTQIRDWLNEEQDQIGQKVRTGSERKAYLHADARAQYGDIEAVIQQLRL